MQKLVETTGMRFFETPMGKSTLDEGHELFGGSYSGANSLPVSVFERKGFDCMRERVRRMRGMTEGGMPAW